MANILPRTSTDVLLPGEEIQEEEQMGSNISVPLSTARWLVPVSAAFNIGCQFYGMGTSLPCLGQSLLTLSRQRPTLP